jgi:small subunit ribosomal protein S3Ae
MALARSRAASRRVKDKWKSKKWYKVTAPTAFSNKSLGETLADEPEKLTGRQIETTLQELTGDMKQMHIKLTFKVSEVLDTNAKTVFTGHNMTSDYIRRLTRRGATKISAVFDLKTKDGSRIRVKPFAITDRRCQTTQAQAIRALMHEQLDACAQANSLSGFIAEILVGDLTGRIYKEARKIHPVRRVEVSKTEVMKAPSIEMDETPMFAEESAAPAASAEPAEDGEAVEVSDDSEEEAVEVSDDSEEEAVEVSDDSEEEAVEVSDDSEEEAVEVSDDSEE